MLLTGAGVLGTGVVAYYFFTRKAAAAELNAAQQDAIATGGQSAQDVATDVINAAAGGGGWAPAPGYQVVGKGHPQLKSKIAKSLMTQQFALAKKHGVSPAVVWRKERQERIEICKGRNWDNNRCKSLRARLEKYGIDYSGYGAYGVDWKGSTAPLEGGRPWAKWQSGGPMVGWKWRFNPNGYGADLMETAEEAGRGTMILLLIGGVWLASELMKPPARRFAA
jgi:hypothetical protein